MKTSQQIQAMRAELLDWYGREGRTLPWRIRPEDRVAGVAADPYKIWLSEIMCQQTTTTAAAAYWHKFLDKWPSVQDLAAAPRDDILTAWAGLGYYARARNLHKCAQMICTEHSGLFPDNEAGLLKLPGIGPYSAAAIAAICYNEATNVVDGNVERVISRIFRVQEVLPKARSEIRKLAATLADPARPGDYAQGLMDLGAHICKPKNPKCDLCPWQIHCAAYGSGDMIDYPKRKPKATRPNRYGAVFYVEDNGQIWLRQRPDKGLLGGMMELPGTDWSTDKPKVDTWLAQAPVQSNWQRVGGEVVHVFTHFTLYLTVFIGQTKASHFDISAHMNTLDNYALPSVMGKAITHAQAMK
ncbi:MAG: A/G-specific adenine glycosylase [Robiginitomaculum sp.]|nr:A/G-specific adenine glycosylase [Robiginitomaculum sp.]